MTDGYENTSKEYTLSQIKDKIKHQTEKYSWEFVYVGADITDAKDAVDIGINTRYFSAKKSVKTSYDSLNRATTAYRMSNCASVGDRALSFCLSETAANVTKKYEDEIGQKISGNE